MAHSINLIKFYSFFIFLSCCSFCFGKYKDIDQEVFKALSDANQKWLQYTSIPEAARLLNFPPYSYHSSGLGYDVFNTSDLFQTKNGSFWDIALDHENEGNCSDDLIKILENLGSQWTLQMLDSNGKLASGILRGGLIWPGHYRECISVYVPLDDNGHGDFHGKYCVSSWTLHIGGEYPSLPLTIGLCVPDSCSGDNLKTAIKNSTFILDYIPFLKKLKSDITLDKIVCKNKTRTVDAPSIVYLIIVSIFIFLTIFGSSWSVYDNWKSECLMKRGLLHHTSGAQDYGTLQIPDISINAEEQNPKNLTSVVFENESPHSAKVVLTPVDSEHVPMVLCPKQQESAWKRVLFCFSVFPNGQRILNTNNVDGQLLSIHGIRFLSLTWVILGHTYISSISMIGNRLDVLKDLDKFPFQMLLQSPFSVDSFFLLSGFLLAYLFLKEITKKHGKISWLYFYIHRIWRLTPAYIVAVFFYMLIFKFLGSGPFWDDYNCDASRGTWWKYVLYINNFIPIHQMCLGWSWYLANDMQFYIISPLFLYPLWRWPIAGFTILGSILVATWTTTGVMSYIYDLIPMFVGATSTHDFTAYEKKMWDSFDLIYDKPYCRIAPYIVGVILGYILHRTGDRKNFLNWWQQLLGWAIAAGSSLSVVFGLYHVEMSRTVSLFYNALCRTSYSIGLAWLIFACETGHGGFLTKFFSWKLFIPLSRLTYCTYLIHPMLIHGYYQSSQSAIYFTELFAVTNFLGFLLMSYGIAFLYSLVFESPFMNLEKLLVKRKSK